MKISIDVDCTPEEAHAFLGLPDVVPMQRALMEEIGKRMGAGLESMDLEAMDLEALMKTWMPLGVQGLEQAQKMFWSQIGKAAGGDKDKAES